MTPYQVQRLFFDPPKSPYLPGKAPTSQPKTSVALSPEVRELTVRGLMKERGLSRKDAEREVDSKSSKLAQLFKD